MMNQTQFEEVLAIRKAEFEQVVAIRKALERIAFIMEFRHPM